MKKAIINFNVCKNCPECAVQAGCPMHAVVKISGEDNVWVDFYKCSGCCKCQSNCPNKAVEIIMHPCDGKPRIGW